MTMRYGIHPLSSVQESYVWNFGVEEQAKCQAKHLAEKYGVEVLVFEIIGTYSKIIQWQEQDKD